MAALNSSDSPTPSIPKYSFSYTERYLMCQEWTFPTVETPPPARVQGVISNDVIEFIQDFEYESASEETIFYTFSEVVKNRKMFVGGYMIIAAKNLRDIVAKLKWENEYNDGPYVQERERSYETLLELADLIENC
jgi:hypothetical protein